MTSRRRRTIAAFFYFSLVVFVYLLTYRGTIQTDDEQLFAAVAQNLAFHGSFSAEQLLGNSRLAGEFNGSGIAHVVLGGLVTKLLDPTNAGFVQGLLLSPVLYLALAGTFIFLFVSESGYPIRFALLAACIFSFASIAWVYSQGYFREPLAALFVAGSLFYGRRCRQPDPAEKRVIAIAGFLLSLAGLVLTKASLVLIVPGILFALWNGRTFDPSTRRFSVRIFMLAAAAIIAAIFIARTVIPITVPTHYDYPRSIIAIIQSIAARPQDQFVTNVLAPIVSPGGGLLFFSPMLFLCLFSWNHAGQEWKGYTIAAVWSVAAIVVLEAAVYGNEGWSLVWGPRRLLPILPLILISGIPLLDRLFHSKKTWGGLASGIVLAVSVGIQLGGVLVSKAQVWMALNAELGDFYSDGLVWSFRYSPIVYTWKLLLNEVSPDLAIVRVNQAGMAWIWGIFLILILTGIVLAVIGLARGLSAGASGRPIVWMAGIGILLIATPLLLLGAVQGDPAYFSDGRFQEAAAYLDGNVSEDDALVVDYYLAPFWGFLMNYNGTRHVAWHSLPIPGDTFRPRQSAAFRAAIAGLDAHESIWIVSENPEFEVGENFVHVEELLDGYTLVSIEGFSDSMAEPSLIVFHFQRLDGK